MACENREYNKVVDYIKELLATEKITVGDKLPTERVIAETLSISRNSTREALRILGNMGLITSKQGSGNYLVGDITQSIVDSLNMMLIMKTTSKLEISQLRRYMELSAFHIAFDNHSDVNTNELADVLDKMNNANIQDKIHLDKEFHYMILSASNNQLMISIMNALSEIYENFVGYVLTTADRNIQKRLWQTHRSICQSFVETNKDLGIKAINEHYDIIEKELINMQ